MDEKIKRCIENCVTCIVSEKKKGKLEGQLRPIPKGDVPLDTFHVDHLGPMPSTRKSYNYILTVVDAFTKFVWLFPTKTTNSEEVVNKLMVIAGLLAIQGESYVTEAPPLHLAILKDIV